MPERRLRGSPFRVASRQSLRRLSETGKPVPYALLGLLKSSYVMVGSHQPCRGLTLKNIRALPS